MAGGFVLFGRQNKTAGLPGAERPTVPGTHDEIHLRFRGIEGEPWPNPPEKLGEHLHEGMLPFKSYPPGLKYYQAMAGEFLCDWLYIEPFTHMGGDTELPRDFVLLGFDFGLFLHTPDYTASRSKVYSEVLFGEHDELREMAGELNENLLFGDHRTLKLFGRTLTRMMSTGNFEMAESQLGQGYSIYGLPQDQRTLTKKYYEPPSFLEN